MILKQNTSSLAHREFFILQTAHLDLDTHAGQAWVGLKVMLNSAEQRETMTKWKTKTEWKTKTDLKTKSKHRNPSYLRRQERRKAARTQSAAEASLSSKNTEEVYDKATDTAEKAKDSESSKADEDEDPDEDQFVYQMKLWYSDCVLWGTLATPVAMRCSD